MEWWQAVAAAFALAAAALIAARRTRPAGREARRVTLRQRLRRGARR